MENHVGNTCLEGRSTGDILDSVKEACGEYAVHVRGFSIPFDFLENGREKIKECFPLKSENSVWAQGSIR